MLLIIDFDENQAVYNKKGRIVLNLKYYADFATGPHFVTMKGHTAKDFENWETNESLSTKTLFVGQRGGISIES